MIASIGKFICCSVTVTFAVLVLLASLPVSVSAQTSNPLKYDFGGESVFVFPCLNGIFVIGSPPKPGPFMYVWGISALKQYGPPKGVRYAILGSSTQFRPCLWPCPTGTGVCAWFWGELVLPNSGSGLLPKTSPYMSV